MKSKHKNSLKRAEKLVKTAMRNNVRNKKFINNTWFELEMGTSDFLSRSKRPKDGGVDFGTGTGKEIKLIIGVEKPRFTFVGSLRISQRIERELSLASTKRT